MPGVRLGHFVLLQRGGALVPTATRSLVSTEVSFRPFLVLSGRSYRTPLFVASISDDARFLLAQVVHSYIFEKVGSTYGWGF